MGDRRDTTDITPGARETMQRAPLPENESTYLDELHQYQTLDTPPEGIFNNVKALAAIRELAGHLPSYPHHLRNQKHRPPLVNTCEPESTFRFLKYLSHSKKFEEVVWRHMFASPTADGTTHPAKPRKTKTLLTTRAQET